MVPLHRSDVCAVTRAYHDVDRVADARSANVSGHVEAGADDHRSTPVSARASLGGNGIVQSSGAVGSGEFGVTAYRERASRSHPHPPLPTASRPAASPRSAPRSARCPAAPHRAARDGTASARPSTASRSTGASRCQNASFASTAAISAPKPAVDVSSCTIRQRARPAHRLEHRLAIPRRDRAQVDQLARRPSNRSAASRAAVHHRAPASPP